jgi:hypothetical protein
MLDGANLILDATAEYGVSYLLSELARDRDLPYVSITAEQGAWGGTVLAVLPGKAGGTQPEGCAAPTFTGASFELMPIVAEGVRTVVSILTAGADTGYPGLGWDVAVGSLRTQTGSAIPATWQTFPLRTHVGCPRCGRRIGAPD